MDEDKKAEWCVKGATTAANYPDGLYGVTRCAVAIPLLQKYHKFKKVIESCLMYKERYIGAEWQLGYAYCIEETRLPKIIIRAQNVSYL